jgi:hypothetical protein
VNVPHVVLFFFWMVIALLAPSVARADTEDPRAQARETFERAEADDARYLFAVALAEYDAAVAADPSASFVPKARARAAMLRAHDEGEFAPLARLERVRRDPKRANDPQEIDTLARDAAGFPAGHVRAEARMLVAEAYAGRLRRPAEAVPILEEVVGDEAADPLTARLAMRMLVTARLDAGDVDAAAEDVRRHPERADPTVADDVHRRIRRRTTHAGALGVLAVASLMAVAGLLRAALRGGLGPAKAALRASWMVTAVFAAFVACAGALLATQFETGTGGPFFAFGAALVPIVLAARAWAAVGAESAAARVGRGGLSAAAVVAAGFLVLEWSDVRYLASFGL